MLLSKTLDGFSRVKRRMKFLSWPKVLEDSKIKVVRLCISDSQGLVQNVKSGFRPPTVRHGDDS